MPIIKTEQLKEGMIVASDVKNMDGMLLIPAGCAITERQCNILQSWGITDVDVESSDGSEDSGDPLAKLPPETVQQITGDLKKLFWKLDESNKAAMEIFNLMLRRKARRMLGK
jgi:hypothetical protein